MFHKQEWWSRFLFINLDAQWLCQGKQVDLVEMIISSMQVWTKSRLKPLILRHWCLSVFVFVQETLVPSHLRWSWRKHFVSTPGTRSLNSCCTVGSLIKAQYKLRAAVAGVLKEAFRSKTYTYIIVFAWWLENLLYFLPCLLNVNLRCFPVIQYGAFF